MSNVIPEDWESPEDAFVDMASLVVEMNDLKRAFDALTDLYSDGLVEIRERGWGAEWNAWLIGEDGDGSGLGDV